MIVLLQMLNAVGHSLALRLVGTATVTILLTSALAYAQPEYRLEIVDPVPGHDSMYPTDISEYGILVGYGGSNHFDPMAQPLGNGFGRTIEVPKLTDSLNLILGFGRVDLVVGTSSYQPCAWVRGIPRFLKSARGLPQGFAYDVNSKGIIVGAAINDLLGEQYPVVWLNVNREGVGLPGIGDSETGAAFAINERNQVAGIVERVGNFNFVAVRWDGPHQPPLQIDPLDNGINCEAVAINNLGDIVGRTAFPDFSLEAMAYFESTGETVGLGRLGGNYSFANGINDQQQIVGTSSTDDQRVHGFLWQQRRLYDLNDLIKEASDPYLYVSDAVAINAAGVIAVEVIVEEGTVNTARMGRLIPLR